MIGCIVNAVENGRHLGLERRLWGACPGAFCSYGGVDGREGENGVEILRIAVLTKAKRDYLS
jgi:hypothetical protein